MNDIQVETDRLNRSMSLVFGPYEVSYGRPHFGNVRKVGAKFEAMSTDGKVIDTFKTKKAAVGAVVHWAENNLTAESVRLDYEEKTAGGHKLTFLRRIVGPSQTHIVASFTHKGEGVQTSWTGRGDCEVYRDPSDPEMHRLWKELKLVRRAPTVENDVIPEVASSPRL